VTGPFSTLVEQVEKDLESLKWHLWNGNVDQALELVSGLLVLLADDSARPQRQKLLKAVREFGATTAFVESAVNHLVSKRMVKQQQMHWTERGAHLLLQVRAQVLNDELRRTFCRWYPAMKSDALGAMQMAA
jgi:hypothetical protein